jgi:hypothetical protein
MKHEPTAERQAAPITPPQQPRRSAIARLIHEATGVDSDADLAELETIMRDDIWHSTLDWQTREELVKSAREARDLQLELRKLGQQAS